MQTKNKLGIRMWMFLLLVGFAGQLAWALENMYLNTYITYLNFSAPAGETFNYSFYIALTTALSAVAATLTTIFVGALIDKIGKKREFISFGYICWGIATASFGLFNVNSTSKILPIALVSSIAAIFVIIIDCVMTFFGSTANDAAFNTYVTSAIPDNKKGKVEGVLSILPLIAMLFIFVGLNGLTVDSSTGVHDAKWDVFFYLIGALVLFVGVLSYFLIPKEVTKEASKDAYLKILITGFKKETIKKNANLYLVLCIYFIYATASNVFFPYLMVYLERTCGVANTGTGMLTPFATVMAVALLLGSVLSVILGSISDKVGKNIMIIPALAIYAVGLLLMFFIPSIPESTKTLYASVAGLVMILGYVGIPTIVNAIVRTLIPTGKEGTFMGIRMLFVVALPMIIGPFIGNALNNQYGDTFINEFGDASVVPTAYGYLAGIVVLLFTLIPTVIYLKKQKKN